MHIPRFIVSALSGGGGKTLLSLGLGRAFTKRKIRVKPFKKGPDYIDAAWLARACEQSATNLDPFFLSSDKLHTLFVRSAQDADIAIVEGNRGLFDGLDTSGSCSTAELARILACPVILSVNCTKVTRTVAALVQGVCHFEQGVTVAGVVLNAVGSVRHAGQVRKALEEYTSVPVLGELPRLSVNPLPERHMGIASQGDELGESVEATLEHLAAFVTENSNLDTFLDIARSAPDLLPASGDNDMTPDSGLTGVPRIGYVRDGAFWFYYPENLQMLENAGATLVPLRIVGADDDLSQWRSLHGLYLGGGFPEDHVESLAQSPILPMLRDMAHHGMPMYAECGGFMLLARYLSLNGRQWPMAGVFPVGVEWDGRPQGLGYVEGRITEDNPFFPVGMSLRGHEFHYSRAVGEFQGTMTLERGTGMGKGIDGLVYRNVWASYTHIFAPAVPLWAPHFVAAAHRFATLPSHSVHKPA